jgi:hypothetical protein
MHSTKQQHETAPLSIFNIKYISDDKIKNSYQYHTGCITENCPENASQTKQFASLGGLDSQRCGLQGGWRPENEFVWHGRDGNVASFGPSGCRRP